MTLAAASIRRTSSRPMSYLASVMGLSSTRTAGSEAPPTKTCPTPSIWASFCWRIVEATSYIRPVSTVAEVSAMIMIGASAGFTLRYVGLMGRFDGSWPAAALIADWTSRAAPLMSRARSNCRATLVEPRKLAEVISVTAAIRPNWRSSGVATAEAMVSGLAPGSDAETWMVGKSTWGSGATGSSR
jgi:hypothetical protein